MKITKEKLRQIIKEEVETAGDVKRVSKRLEKISGLESLLDKVNSRIEFEQFLRKVVRLGSKNVKHEDVLLALRNVLGVLNKEMINKEMK